VQYSNSFIIFFSLSVWSKFIRKIIGNSKKQKTNQVRWRQQTLPSVYFESSVDTPSTSNNKVDNQSTSTNNKTRSPNPGNVKWSYSIQSSHGTSVHSSFDTLEGTHNYIFYTYELSIKIAQTLLLHKLSIKTAQTLRILYDPSIKFTHR